MRERGVDGLGQNRPEAGHGHQVDLVGHQRGGDGGGEPLSVELGAEAAVGPAIDELGRGPYSSAISRAAQGRSARTVVTGRPSSNMARRIVPEPETRTARRTKANLVGPDRWP